MSTFEVKVREITQLDPHPNADKLELVVIGGYKAVVQKGIHKVGDLIVYVPEDTVFTDIEVAQKLGVDGYLTGKNKNRVKSIKLRGILSQGIVLPRSAFEGKFPFFAEGESMMWMPFIEIGPNDIAVTGSDDIIAILKLEKYEEPIPVEMAGHVRKWPSFLNKYEIENSKRPESIGVIKDGELVIFTEKLHGTNITVGHGAGLEEGERGFVCSRNNALKESDTNVYWRAERKYDLINKVLEIAWRLNHTDPWAGEGVGAVSIHGEVVGVQDLKYGCTNSDIGFYAFDIKVDGVFLDYDVFVYLCTEFGIPMVPVIYSGPYNREKLNELATGKTLIPGADHIREGGVAKPMKERVDEYGQRVIYKHVSDDYLTRKGGTELH